MLSNLHLAKRAPGTAAQTASATIHQLPHLTVTTVSTTATSIMTQKMLMLAYWLDKPFNTVKPLEANRRENSIMPTRDSNSNNNMRAKRRLNCAETLKCTEAASSVTPAPMHMAHINFRRRLISQATS